MSERTFEDVRTNPQAGDVVEFKEGEEEIMLRVLAVAEDFVWFKEYGSGRTHWHITYWSKRLAKGTDGQVIHLGKEPRT